jgi:hypothetical protein
MFKRARYQFGWLRKNTAGEAPTFGYGRIGPRHQTAGERKNR